MQVTDFEGKVCEESKKIWRVALPSILSRVTSFGTVIVTQLFVGHISSLDLAGYALVQTICVQFVNGILIGISSATETLCGQAFGAEQYRMLGIFLQRSWLVNLITLTILLPVFIFAKPIFKLLGEEEAIAKSAGYISLWCIPVIYSIVFSTTIQMYLQAQQKNMVVAWLSIVQFVIHIPMSWLFVYKLDWGIAGGMGALCISSWLLVVGEFVCIKDMLPMVKFSVSSGVMICLELWYNSILVLLAGYMKNAKVAISAISICLNVNGWEFMVSLGILGAACVRVSNELGRGDAKAVKFSIEVLISTSFLIGLFFWVLCIVFGNKIGYLVTNDEEVAQSVADLSLLLAFSVLLNGIFPVFSGVAIGAGLQKTIAIINVVCFYIIGIPIGALLGYVTHLQVKGIWIGMMCGVLTQTLALSFMVWRTDWEEQVSKASARLKKWYLKSSDKSNQKPDQV